LLTHRQTDRQTNKLWQKHNLLGGGNKTAKQNSQTACTHTDIYYSGIMATMSQIRWISFYNIAQCGHYNLFTVLKT